jgi:hypothetical protein
MCWNAAMSEPLTAEKLTTWAAGSESPVVEFVRTTLGPLFLILFTPPAAIIFWIVCTFEPFNGSLSPLLTVAGWRSVATHWPWPSSSAADMASKPALRRRWWCGTSRVGSRRGR